MVAFSPQSDAGGTLHFPSPTHLHIDPASTLRRLQRSISRSPSKNNAFNLFTAQNPTSPSLRSPLSSPSDSGTFTLTATTPTPPRHANAVAANVPSPFTLRKARPATRAMTPAVAKPPPRPSPGTRSPRKRSLQETPTLMDLAAKPTAAQEEDKENASHGRDQDSTRFSTRHSALKVSNSADNHHPSSALPARASHRLTRDFCTWGPKSSPLKRGDGLLGPDRSGTGSPIAKRRSLHSAIFEPDFDIFAHAPALSGVTTDVRMTDAGDAEDSASTQGRPSPPLSSRTSSLRPTTLQQRHDKPSFARAKLQIDQDYDMTSGNNAATKQRPRMSLDSVLEPMPRDSPFSAQGSLPNASQHPMPSNIPKSHVLNAGHVLQRHPLSRTISQSTSTSSMAEDSPTHVPLKQPEVRKMSIFSRSMPPGATRPTSHCPMSSEDSSSNAPSFMTPENYKLVKPLPAAFMSTGLISKRHRNLGETAGDFAASTSTMPDTPCKRHSVAEVTSPKAEIAERPRQTRHSFGTPSTPLHATHFVNDSSKISDKGIGIFRSNVRKMGIPRSDSFVDRLDVEESNNASPCTGNGDSQTSTDFDAPPTPTRQLGGLGSHPGSSARSDGGLARTDGIVHPARPRLITSSLESQSVKDRFKNLSPRTPQEHIVPPDPSGLSISHHGQPALQKLNDMHSSIGKFAPATPTASRELFSSANRLRNSNGYQATHGAAEVDSALTTRFDKSEVIGIGEFSQVYRVSKKQDAAKSPHNYFSMMAVQGSPKTPMRDLVWAVKKSRQAYLGPKDRERKLKEVNVLRGLGTSDHTLEMLDSWEFRNHLYIQTEFCEEGSLDSFLDQVGRRDRLDDFRIWKIMLELAHGLKHIHDSGFIHLDLKPANVLITFEGILKIADFGMATQWPASPGIDGEGDREYIGPEILRGQFDKPADIFALGLIMLEIAANVVLPDNGASWQRLRSGDMSDVPSLTWSSESSKMTREASGKPSQQGKESFASFYDLDDNDGDDDDDHDGATDESCRTINFLHHRDLKTTSNHNHSHHNSNDERYSQTITQPHRSGELASPPPFMTDQNHSEALDKLVRWMISPESRDRPCADAILGTAGVTWTETRRRAGATVFEGNWGPADEVLADDAEMIDV